MSVPFPRPLKLGDQGIDVEGVGRALCKTGFYVTLKVFSEADEEWRGRSASARKTRSTRSGCKHGWKRTGVYNEAVHDVMEKAGYFDARAIDLIKRWKPPPPPKEPQIRAAMSDFCRRAEANESEVALHPATPVLRHSAKPPSAPTTPTARRMRARVRMGQKETGLAVPDPSGYNYAGYGQHLGRPRRPRASQLSVPGR